MSEQTPEAAPATEAPEANPTTTETTPATPAVEQQPAETVEHWREIARMQEKRAKDNAAAAKRLAEIEDAQKSEQQRQIERQTQIERERDEARTEGLRYKAAATHGIGEDYFDLLGSGDEETIAGRAQRVGSLLRENAAMKAELEALRAGKPAPTTARPVEQLKPGATPENTQTQDDVDYAALFGPIG